MQKLFIPAPEFCFVCHEASEIAIVSKSIVPGVPLGMCATHHRHLHDKGIAHDKITMEEARSKHSALGPSVTLKP